MASRDQFQFGALFHILWGIFFICFGGCNSVTMSPVRPAETSDTDIDTTTDADTQINTDTDTELDTATDTGHLGTDSDSQPNIDLGLFGTPELLEISDVTVDEDDPTLTADQLELCFESSRAGSSGLGDIWCATRETVSSLWGTPQNMVDLNSANLDGGPELSADGLTILIFSKRGGGLGQEDIWESTRASRDESWPPPVNVTELNTVASDLFANTMNTGLELVLTRRTDDNDLELVLYTRDNVSEPWGGGVPVVELNTVGRESEGHFANDGLLLAFGSDRSGGAGKSDLYFATRSAIGESFGAVSALTELNTANDESDPWISEDLRTIYYASDQSGTMQIYRASR